MSNLELLDAEDKLFTALVRDIDRARAESYELMLALRSYKPAAADATAVVDALIRELGYRELGAGWIEIPRRIAAKMIAGLIGFDLAYPDEIVPSEQATDLATRFLEFFPAGTRYFTNGACSGEFAVYDLAGEAVLGWRSISEAPLDNGVVAVNETVVGIVWAEDAP
ncbi:MAG: hypothetical protein HC822_13535 [Oscillochloris sp.]|nr:hypothetical protein [Oscillochloris sp.]